MNGKNKQMREKKKTRRNLKVVRVVERKANILNVLIAKRGTIQKKFVGSDQEFNASM